MSSSSDKTDTQIIRPLNRRKRQEDFDKMFQFIRDYYCYFEEKATDWEAVGKFYRPLAIAASDDEKFISILQKTLDQLYDTHTHLIAYPTRAWRLPVLDIWAEQQDGKVIVVEVRFNSQAAAAGIEAGQEILLVNGKHPSEKVAEYYPCCLRHFDLAATECALLSVLSRRPNHSRVLTVKKRNNVEQTLQLTDYALPSQVTEEPVSAQSLLDDLGYIRIASFANPKTIADFDHALDSLQNAQGLIIDVRNNPGGDTAVARPIMGRLIQEKKQYAWMARRDGVGLGNRWPEYVEPRGPWTYTSPIVVLVNHWSASMAEGFAMGLDGMGRATVVGTRMAGLGAAISRTDLPHIKMSVQISSEPVYHVNGIPRHLFYPVVEVNTIMSDARESDDPFLDTGMRILHKLLSRNRT